MRPQIGQIINGKYKLVRLLGDGGMGAVFEARHEKLSITVALKFLHPELSRRGGIVDRFLQEARASAQIKNAHVVGVTDVDQTPDGIAFIVLEYIEGRTLQSLYEDYHHTGQRLSYAEALDYAMQMIDGLEAAHAAGVVHRDLKPENVMITRGAKGDLLKLLDFGIAKLKVVGEVDKGLTKPGVVMGTPEYMAPEQAYAADGVDARADVFSIGVILFEMLAGRRPVGGEEPHVIANAYLAGQTARLEEIVTSVAPDLAAVVHKAMAPLARDRFSTARALREALEPYAEEARREAPGAPSHGGPPPKADAGSSPRMPPVDVSAGAAGTIIDGLGAANPGGARVAPTWPPEADAPEPPRGDATRAMDPLDDQPRPGPTAPGGDDDDAPASPAARPNGGQTAMMPGLDGAEAAAPAPRAPKRPRRRGMSGVAIAGITLVGVGALVGVTMAVRGSSSDDAGPRGAAPAPVTAVARPPLLQPPPPPPEAPPQAQPPPAAPPPPPAAAPPGPHGPSTAPPHGSSPAGMPSNLPPGMPSSLPPGLPSGFPSGPFPGLPGSPSAAPPPPNAQPTGQPSAPGAIPGLPPLNIPSGLPSFPSPFPPPPG